MVMETRAKATVTPQARAYGLASKDCVETGQDMAAVQPTTEIIAATIILHILLSNSEKQRTTII